MMESKLLLMMKGKFESLFILYTVYKMMEPWKHEPVQKKEKKKRGTGEGLWCLHVTFSCLCILIFFKPGLQGVQGLNNFNLQPTKLVFPPPPPSSLPLLNHEAPPSFRLWISLCIIIGDEEFVNYYTRWLLFVILQSNIKATCCIKDGLWFNLLPPNALKCCS